MLGSIGFFWKWRKGTMTAPIQRPSSSTSSRRFGINLRRTHPRHSWERTWFWPVYWRSACCPLATACVILNQVWDLSTHARNGSLSLKSQRFPCSVVGLKPITPNPFCHLARRQHAVDGVSRRVRLLDKIVLRQHRTRKRISAPDRARNCH